MKMKDSEHMRRRSASGCGMWRRRACRALCLLAAMALGMSATAIAQEGLDAASYRQTLVELTQRFRWAGTPEAQQAADEIAARFAEYGYDVQRQSFQFTEEAKGKQASTEAENIIAVKQPNLSPTGDILIISAHYDSKEATTGANDDASGQALLMELARVLKDVDTDTELRFISFCAEEEGLRGSAAYVEALTQREKDAIIGVIQIDMIGHYRSSADTISTAFGNEELLGQLLATASEEITGAAWQLERDAASDHASFAFAGIPAVMVAQQKVGEAENHRFIDNISTIDMDMAVNTGRVVEQVIRDIASKETGSLLADARSMTAEAGSVEILNSTPILFGVNRQDVAVKLGAAGTFEKDEMGEFGYEQSHYIVNARWFGWEPLETDFIYRKDTLTLDRVLIRTAPLGLTDEALAELLTGTLGEPEIFEGGAAQWGSGSMAENPSLRQYLIGEDDGQQVIEVISYMHFNVGEDIQVYDIHTSAEAAAGDAADIAVLKAVQRLVPEEDSYVKNVISWTDGYSYVLGSCTADDMMKSDSFSVRIDKNDFFNADGSFVDESKFLATAVHEYGHALTLNAGQLQLDSLSETASYADMDIYREDSYMRAFYDAFYAEGKQRDFYEHPEDFVNEYAGTGGVFEDIAECFMQFVIGSRQEGDSLAAQKINFFYGYPEMTAAREHIRASFGYEAAEE